MEQIDAFIRQQSQVDLDARIKEEETDPFLKENGEGVKKLWKHVAECGESTFPNPPCLSLRPSGVVPEGQNIRVLHI